MVYKVQFYKRPPEGMTLVESKSGYVIIINSVNWNAFPIWIVFAGLFLFFFVKGIIGSFAWWIGGALFFYFAYISVNTVFMRVKIVIEDSFCKFFFFKDSIFGLKPYVINFMEIRRIRLAQPVSVSRGNRSRRVSDGGYIEITTFRKDEEYPISVFTDEYNIYILHFLKEYLRVWTVESGKRRIINDQAGSNGMVLEKI